MKQNQNRAREMTQCQGDACGAVVEKYKKINAEQHERVVGCKGAQDCVNKANEVSELQADYARRTGELLEKERVKGSLSPTEQDELAFLQVTTIQLEADRTAAIHNALMSGDSSEAKQLAINSLAQVAGTSAAGIAAGIGKGGKGSSLPTPTVSATAKAEKSTLDDILQGESQTAKNTATTNKAESAAAGVISNEAHNAASYAGLKLDLQTTQAANDVVDSLRTTGKLPSNYVTKQVAEDNGWAGGKALNNYVSGGQIGGDVFHNTTNLLPSAPGRSWYEADVGLNNTMSRAKQAGTRLLYSNDGLLYITTDHYETATSIGKWK